MINRLTSNLKIGKGSNHSSASSVSSGCSDSRRTRNAPTKRRLRPAGGRSLTRSLSASFMVGRPQDPAASDGPGRLRRATNSGRSLTRTLSSTFLGSRTATEEPKHDPAPGLPKPVGREVILQTMDDVRRLVQDHKRLKGHQQQQQQQSQKLQQRRQRRGKHWKDSPRDIVVSVQLSPALLSHLTSRPPLLANQKESRSNDAAIRQDVRSFREMVRLHSPTVLSWTVVGGDKHKPRLPRWQLVQNQTPRRRLQFLNLSYITLWVPELATVVSNSPDLRVLRLDRVAIAKQQHQATREEDSDSLSITGSIHRRLQQTLSRRRQNQSEDVGSLDPLLVALVAKCQVIHTLHISTTSASAIKSSRSKSGRSKKTKSKDEDEYLFSIPALQTLCRCPSLQVLKIPLTEEQCTIVALELNSRAKPLQDFVWENRQSNASLRASLEKLEPEGDDSSLCDSSRMQAVLGAAGTSDQIGPLWYHLQQKNSSKSPTIVASNSSVVSDLTMGTAGGCGASVHDTPIAEATEEEEEADTSIVDDTVECDVVEPVEIKSEPKEPLSPAPQSIFSETSASLKSGNDAEKQKAEIIDVPPIAVISSKAGIGSDADDDDESVDLHATIAVSGRTLLGDSCRTMNDSGLMMPSPIRSPRKIKLSAFHTEEERCSDVSEASSVSTEPKMVMESMISLLPEKQDHSEKEDDSIASSTSSRSPVKVLHTETVSESESESELESDSDSEPCSNHSNSSSCSSMFVEDSNGTGIARDDNDGKSRASYGSTSLTKSPTHSNHASPNNNFPSDDKSVNPAEPDERKEDEEEIPQDSGLDLYQFLVSGLSNSNMGSDGSLPQQSNHSVASDIVPEAIRESLRLLNRTLNEQIQSEMERETDAAKMTAASEAKRPKKNKNLMAFFSEEADEEEETRRLEAAEDDLRSELSMAEDLFSTVSNRLPHQQDDQDDSSYGAYGEVHDDSESYYDDDDMDDEYSRMEASNQNLQYELEAAAMGNMDYNDELGHESDHINIECVEDVTWRSPPAALDRNRRGRLSEMFRSQSVRHLQIEKQEQEQLIKEKLQLMNLESELGVTMEVEQHVQEKLVKKAIEMKAAKMEHSFSEGSYTEDVNSFSPIRSGTRAKRLSEMFRVPSNIKDLETEKFEKEQLIKEKFRQLNLEEELGVTMEIEQEVQGKLIQNAIQLKEFRAESSGSEDSFHDESDEEEEQDKVPAQASKAGLKGFFHRQKDDRGREDEDQSVVSDIKSLAGQRRGPFRRRHDLEQEKQQKEKLMLELLGLDHADQKAEQEKLVQDAANALSRAESQGSSKEDGQEQSQHTAPDQSRSKRLSGIFRRSNRQAQKEAGLLEEKKRQEELIKEQLQMLDLGDEDLESQAKQTELVQEIEKRQVEDTAIDQEVSSNRPRRFFRRQQGQQTPNVDLSGDDLAEQAELILEIDSPEPRPRRFFRRQQA